MKVLHFIDKRVKMTDNEVFGYLPSLLHELSDNMETIIIAPHEVLRMDTDVALSVLRYHSSSFYVLRNKLLFSRLLEKEKPVLVHIHGCTSLLSSLFMNKCMKLNIPVVLSTGKLFEPWHVKPSYLSSVFPRLLLFQHNMLKRTCAIHTLCEQENSDLLRFWWHPLFKSKTPWNGNITVIEDFNKSSETSVSRMALDMSDFYSKVADSNPFMMLSESDKKCEDIMLIAGATPEQENAPLLSSTDKNILSSLDEISMRRILIHASDQGIYKYVMDSALRFKLHIPALNVSTLSRFKSFYGRSRTGNIDLASLKERIDSDETLTSVERDVCLALLSTWLKYRTRSLRRADLASLYLTLRFTDYDEVMLLHSLSRMKFAKRSARLLALLGERYTLGEGFMFMPPLNDRVTKRMRKRLFRDGVQ